MASLLLAPAALGLTLLAAVPTTRPEPPSAQVPLRSVYTSLAPERCRLLRTFPETGGTVQRCPGVARHALDVTDDDSRMSVGVVTPGGRVHHLRLPSVVSAAFSSLGPRAEWRMRGQGSGARPVALIVRFNAYQDPQRPERATSYLAVAKITARGICVTDRIRPSADANEKARRAADTSGSRPCLSPP